MLEDGRAQLADAQSDILPGPRARVLAVLYDDAFQLLVPKIRSSELWQICRVTGLHLHRAEGNFNPFSEWQSISAFIERIFNLSAQLTTRLTMRS